MDLIRTIDGARRERLEALYVSAFPKEERKPYELMAKKQEEGFVDLLSLEEDGEFIGLAILVKQADLVLLDYFAIDDKKRGGGYGSQALAELFSRYKGKRLVLEIESTKKECADHENRMRRKAFYLRNGLTELLCRVLLFGIEMELLSNGTAVSFEEYQGIYAAAFGPRTYEFVKPLEGNGSRKISWKKCLCNIGFTSIMEPDRGTERPCKTTIQGSGGAYESDCGQRETAGS